MSSGAILALAIVAIAVLGGVFVVVTLARSDRNAATGLLARETTRRDRAARREAKKAAAAAGDFLPAPITSTDVERIARGTDLQPVGAKVPATVRPAMDPEQLGQTRRQFMNRSTIAMFTAGIGGFGGSVLAFLWPSLGGGFGGKVKAGVANDISNAIESKREPFYVAEARSYIVEYPKDALVKAETVYSGVVVNGMKSGYIALYQKCPHLGCKVPWCGNSQWFECPCHGSQYNRVGERRGGPAPRGMDHFAVSVDPNGVVTVDTASVIAGPALGTDTTGQQAEGPHCVGAGGSH
jgi:cytochrome b6-f complex iron-sulfur subunit